MSGYDSKHNIETKWSYRDLLEMIYIEDIQAINQHIANEKQKEIQELEDMISG